MASLANQVSFFFLLVLFLSPQIQARQSKFFSFFTHFKTTHNVEDPQLPQSPAPAPAPAPAQEPASAPAQEPAAAPEIESTTLPSGPAPEPQFLVETGNGYGLYGIDSTSQYSPTKETPKTTLTDFEDELLNEDFNDNKLLNEDLNDNKSYKKGYPQTNIHNNNEIYTKNYNNEENKNNYNSYNGKEFYNNNNNNHERKGEGMSDTRFMENGKYYYNVNSENENYKNVNEYESGRGSAENEGNYEKNQYQNEFETMEEYEKQQEAQGYTYTP